MHTQTFAHIHTRTHSHTFMHTHSHTNTNTHSLARSQLKRPPPSIPRLQDSTGSVPDEQRRERAAQVALAFARMLDADVSEQQLEEPDDQS